MSSPKPSNANDALLLPFLHAQDQEEEARCLAELLDTHTEEIAGPIIKAKLRFSPGHAGEELLRLDAEDISGEVRHEVLRRLQQLKSFPNKFVIDDLRGYVEATTHYACKRYLREKYPQRAQMKNKLKYLLTHHPDFALWEGEAHLRFAGFAAWRGQSAPSRDTQALDQLRRDSQIEHAGQAREKGARKKLPALVSSIFRQAGAPLQLDELVNLVAEVLGVKDQPILSLRTEDDFAGYMAAAQPGVEDEIEQRERLKQVWAEICQLPRRQRIALLLNLHSADGDIMLFAFHRIASIRQIAAALEMPLSQFAQLWRQLPLKDEVIAAYLGATRQQVVNSRKSARERLRRRLREAANDADKMSYVVMSLLIYHLT